MKISIYSKSGIRAATTYYRFSQYFDRFKNLDVKYRKMLSDNFHKRIMPINTKPLPVKVFVFLYVYIRVLTQLIKDCFFRSPDVLIVSRRFINRKFPSSYKLLICILKSHGTKLIWDFDDQIIKTKEITRKNFDWMSRYADVITVAGLENKKMIDEKFWDKVVVMPTTDGDMFHINSPKLLETRLNELEKNINIIWVGTSGALEFVKAICPAIEKLGQNERNSGKSIVLTVVCNLPLDYEATNFRLRNISWERDIAIKEMCKAHIGIMPLLDNETTRGKGGFKLIQYLSIGLPVVGSSVGINNEIIDPSVGRLVSETNVEQWFDAFS